MCSRVQGAKALASYSCYNGGNVDGGLDTWYEGCNWSERPCVFSPYYLSTCYADLISRNGFLRTPDGAAVR